MTTESVVSKRSRKGRIVGGAAASIGAAALVWWYMHPLSFDSRCSAKQGSDILLDRFLPHAEFSGAVSVVIHAPPDDIFRALYAVTLADMPVARWMGEIRYLPGRLTGKSTATPSSEPFMQIVRADSGTIILAEEPDREVVLGSIGKYHDLVDQQVVPIQNAADFMCFDDPEYQKLAMSLRVSGDDPETGYRLTLEHRTHALGSAARWKFGLYWLAIKPGGNFVSWLMLRAIKRRAEAAWLAKQNAERISHPV